MTDRLTSYTREGLTFDVRDEGPLDGDVVVLLHGFPQRADSWDQVVPLLHAAGLRTVAPDQRGYSPGARPKGRWAYRSSELVADVAALVEALGQGPVHLVGHDWGSAIAWGLAGERPDLVRSLVAVSVPHPGAFFASMVRSSQLLRSWYMGFFQLPAVPERLAQQGRMFPSFLRKAGMSGPMVEKFRADFVDGGRLGPALNWYRAIPFARPADTFRTVTVPTTLVWSDRDAALGRSGVDLTADKVRAPYELVVLGGVSHWIPDHAPEPLAQAILDRVASVADAA